MEYGVKFTNDSMSFFCLHRFALSTNPRITPAEISRYRLIPMSVLLISRQPIELQISFGFARAMPTTNPRTGMLWERDCFRHRKKSKVSKRRLTDTKKNETKRMISRANCNTMFLLFQTTDSQISRNVHS